MEFKAYVLTYKLYHGTLFMYKLIVTDTGPKILI